MGSVINLSSDQAAMLLVLIESEKKQAEKMMRRAKFFGVEQYFVRMNQDRIDLLNQLERKVFAGIK